MNENDTHLHATVKWLRCGYMSEPKRMPSPPPPRTALPEYRSEELLKSSGQAAILHRGQRYTLRETRAGKLILYK